MAVYGYTRVSTSSQIDNTSLEEQTRKINAVAQYHGIRVDDIFREEGVSGSISLSLRPAGYKMLARLKSGDTIIAAKLDRMFRSAQDALVTAERWASQGVKLIVADISTDPISENGMGKLFFTLLAAMAEFERSRIAERVAAGKYAKKQSGGYSGGKRPFGYYVEGTGKEAMLMPHPEEYPAIQFILECRRDRNLSLREICDEVEGFYDISISLATIAKIIKENGLR